MKKTMMAVVLVLLIAGLFLAFLVTEYGDPKRPVWERVKKVVAEPVFVTSDESDEETAVIDPIKTKKVESSGSDSDKKLALARETVVVSVIAKKTWPKDRVHWDKFKAKTKKPKVKHRKVSLSPEEARKKLEREKAKGLSPGEARKKLKNVMKRLPRGKSPGEAAKSL